MIENRHFSQFDGGGGTQPYIVRPNLFTNPSALKEAAVEFGIPVPETMSDRLRQKIAARVMEAARNQGSTVDRSQPAERTVFQPFSAELRSSLSQIRDSMKGSPAISDAIWNDTDHLSIPEDESTFAVALELCPLYLPGTLQGSKLNLNPTGEEDVLNSRVGKKWIATQHAVDTLNAFAQKSNRQLVVNATFGDMGVLAATREDADRNAVALHGRVYEELFGEFCRARGIDMTFRNLSDLVADMKTEIPEFLVVEDGTVLPKTPSIEDLKTILNLPLLPHNTYSTRQRAEVLPYAFENLGGNVDVFRGFVNTYLHGIPKAASGSHIHLGMERAAWILKLQAVQRKPHEIKHPALNILVA